MCGHINGYWPNSSITGHVKKAINIEIHPLKKKKKT